MSYVQRFNAESLKVDVPDEKFAITAFIAGLGVQLKDLMFSISKNPQASMAEVLAKVEKYINGEEALISKRGSSSTHKEKNRIDKKRERSPKRQRPREIPKKGQRTIPKEARERQRPPETTLALATAAVFTSAVHPPDSHSITGLARGTT